MKTKMVLIASGALLTTAVVLHHGKECPLGKHFKKMHKVETAKTENTTSTTEVLAQK